MSGRLHQAASVALQAVLVGLARVAFRPKVTYVSDKARAEAFREPQVIVMNHVRGMDGVVAYSLMKHCRITALSAKDLQDENSALRWFMSFLPSIEIDRQHPSMSWLRESRKKLREGSHMMIFPEGKCNKARVIRPFKQGCVLMAASAGARILPIYHNGIYHYFIGRRFRMIIGEPIEVQAPPEGLDSEVMAAETEQLFHTMQSLERTLTGTVRTEGREEQS